MSLGYLLSLISISCLTVNYSQGSLSHLPLIAQDTVLKTVRGKVDGRNHKMVQTKNKLYVVDKRGKRIYVEGDFAEAFEFSDFDKDGYKDIRIYHLTDIPGIQSLLLYDKAGKKFRLVEDFQNYPDPKQIGHHNLYYSYHRNGCADQSWISDLFTIKNYKVIKLATISGDGCQEAREQMSITIYKVRGANKVVVSHRPMSEVEKYKDKKWGFIKAYWSKNYKRFI